MGKRIWTLLGLLLCVLLSGCGSSVSKQLTPTRPLIGDGINVELRPSPTPDLILPRQQAPLPQATSPHLTTPPQATTPPNVTPTATGTSAVPTPTPIPPTGTGPAPYGQPPALTALEIQMTQQLFALINSDRAARGLYPFIWNDTLAGGARLHSWNMRHCGFSHTCPDGLDQCVRIANEGFTGLTDCGECIAETGPDPTLWNGIYIVQEGMINEPPTGWHRIHLTSTTLHRIGVGIYIDSSGTAWITEDMVS